MNPVRNHFFNNSSDLEMIDITQQDEFDHALAKSSPVTERRNQQSHTSANNGQWTRRILSDYSDFQKCGSPWGISAQVMMDDASLWAVQILGPKDTPYEGGCYQGILQFSDRYPFHPPSFTFLTPIFHPNISEDGVICLDQLYKNWSPCHTVWSLLVSIQFMLADANSEEALNPTAALYYASNREQFEEIVKQGVNASRKDLNSSENTFNNVMDECTGDNRCGCIIY